MERFAATRLTAEIHESLQDEYLWAVKQLGIADVFIQNARTAQLHGTTALGSLLGRPERLRENPALSIHCYVPPEHGEATLQFLIRACGLDMPGRGGLMASSVELVAPAGFAAAIRSMRPPRAMLNPLPLHANLMGITCIVQRGQGDLVARSALSLGTSVPAVTFGEGTGLRDKLGLLRVTIPAAKELVHLVVADHDAQGIIQLLIGEARLNQAGKGFISCERIDRALLNTRLRAGRQSHAASMEQIITAIDHLAGNSWWRRRFDQGEDHGNQTLIRDRVGVNCYDDADHAQRYSLAAMAAGAGGATSAEVNYPHSPASASLAGEAGKARTNFVLQTSQLDAVLGALTEALPGEEHPSGFLEIHPVPLSFTYVKKR